MHYATVITGATGFVGGELLVKLLRDSSRPLICPVRAESDDAAIERGANRLIELVGDEDAERFASRIDWLRADIEEPHLGWNRCTWHRVASTVNEIFHCAASVSFDLPIDQAHRINVDGTMHVYELAQAAAARHPGFERFHHVSTAYVAGLTKGRVEADYLPPDRGRLFRNTYEQTKARAERQLRAAATSRVPVSIHRPSIIAGHSRTGRTTNWNVLYVPMKMVARGVLPAFTRGGRELIDAIAVDVLVEAMVIFSQLDSLPIESHHITAGPTAVTATQVISTTRDRAEANPGFTPSRTKLFGPLGWRVLMAVVVALGLLPLRLGSGRLGSIRTKARLAKRCVDKCSVYLPYARVDTVFDASREHDVLRVFGVEMPPGTDYLETILKYALATDFGKLEVAPSDAVAA